MTGHKRDKYGWRAFVKVGAIQREKRFPADSTFDTRERWRDECRVALRKIVKPSGSANTLRADIRRDYLKRPSILALVSYKSRVCELDAWIALLGNEPRGTITRDQILAARDNWLADGYAPKTVNHRVRALRHVYRTLDGSRAPTPCDDIRKLPEPDAQPKFVPVAKIRAVGKRLTDPKTRARFMVLTATGQRPAQLKRAVRTDVNLRRRIWMVRPAKRGNPIPVPLTQDMIVAFKALTAADAWGTFDGSDYAKDLYAAGWPRDVRPYNAKHTVAITLAESDAEWEDIRDWFGQKDIKTTRIYTGLVAKRLKSTSAKLEGRIGWTASRLPAASDRAASESVGMRRKSRVRASGRSRG